MQELHSRSASLLLHTQIVFYVVAQTDFVTLIKTIKSIHHDTYTKQDFLSSKAAVVNHTLQMKKNKLSDCCLFVVAFVYRRQWQMLCFIVMLIKSKAKLTLDSTADHTMVWFNQCLFLQT